jgi:intein/homing endonuclease
VRLDASAQGYSANFTAQSANGAALLVKQSYLKPSYSFEKEIPLEYQNSNKEFLAGLLDGLFSTDGNIDLSSNHPFLRLKTTSKQLAQDVRRVLLSFGIHGRIVTIKKVADGRIGDRAIISRHQQYEVIISGAGMKVFAQEIGLSHPDKQQRLKTAQKEFALTGNTWQLLHHKQRIHNQIYQLYHLLDHHLLHTQRDS